MSSLDSYIKERNERIEKGALVYTNGANTQFSPLTRDFNRMNADTFRHNNGAYQERHLRRY